MLIAIKAPQASYLEVPDPDGVRSGGCLKSLNAFIYITLWFTAFWHEQDIGPPQYKMIARSSTGPIDLYLLRYFLCFHANICTLIIPICLKCDGFCSVHNLLSYLIIILSGTYEWIQVTVTCLFLWLYSWCL